MNIENKTVEAVGFAHRPGRNTIKRDVWRSIQRSIVWALFRPWIPLRARQSAMFFMLDFRQRFFGRPFVLAGGSIGNTFENDLLELIFKTTTIANIAINATSSPLTNLEFALHTADPGETGDQTTSEAAYTSYARVAVARSGSGFTVTANSVSPAATVTFPAGTGGSGTVTHFSVGTAHTSTGKILFSGTVTPNIVTGNGITPALTTATAITLD